jgi:hypothetical protein
VAGILAVPAILVVILVVLRIRAGGAAGRGMDEEDLGADDPDVGDADDEVRRSGAPRR